MNEVDRAVLEFESGPPWVFEGAKAEAVILRFGFSLSRYYQILVRLVTDPEAINEFPGTVARIRRRLGEGEFYGRSA